MAIVAITQGLTGSRMLQRALHLLRGGRRCSTVLCLRLALLQRRQPLDQFRHAAHALRRVAIGGAADVLHKERILDIAFPPWGHRAP